MSREELLELAALDAFGLLDEYDAALFTRSFHHAPAPVQDEIKRLQAELAADPSLLLADEEPPLELRARVLAAVAAAIERDEAQLAPLATIGRTRPGDAAYQPQRLRFSGAGLFWRAACFVLASAVIAMSYSWYTAVQQNARMAQLFAAKSTEEQLRELIGPQFAEYLRTGKSAVTIRAIALRQGDPAVQATLYIKESDGTGFLMALGLPNLPDDQQYTLRVKTTDTYVPIQQFVSNGVVAGVRLGGLTPAMMASASWEIVNPAGEVVLSA